MIGGSSISSIGGNFLLRPLSVSIVVVTKKKIKSKKAISAIDPALTSGADLLAIAIYFLMILVTPEKNIKLMATKAKI